MKWNKGSCQYYIGNQHVLGHGNRGNGVYLYCPHLRGSDSLHGLQGHTPPLSRISVHITCMWRSLSWGALHLLLLPLTCPWEMAAVASHTLLSTGAVHQRPKAQNLGAVAWGAAPSPAAQSYLHPMLRAPRAPRGPPTRTQTRFTFPFVLLESSTWFCQGLRPGPEMTKHPWLPLFCATHACRSCPRRSSCHGPWNSRFPDSVGSPPP